jgi:hypothetical protein
MYDKNLGRHVKKCKKLHFAILSPDSTNLQSATTTSFEAHFRELESREGTSRLLI